MSRFVVIYHQRLSYPELRGRRRRPGIVSLRDVRDVILEEDGHPSVIPQPRAGP